MSSEEKTSTEDFLVKFARNYGYENAKLKFEAGSERGDNFVGIVSKVDIVGDLRGIPSALHVVVKAAPASKEARDTLPTRQLFLREMFAYTDVFPIFEELQEELPEKERFRFVKCYAVNTNDMAELLVMEDMLLQSYRMHKPRLETLDYDHMSAALTALAKFHALSFVLKERNPLLFRKIASEATDEMYLNDNCPMKEYTGRAVKTALQALPQKFENIVNDTYNNIKGILQPQKFSVLCHGDYWKNNILFYYQNGSPTSACPLDYQLLRYASPVTDISYLVFCCTTQELRRLHFEGLMRLYHDALASQLKMFSMDIEKVFPWSEFTEELKRAGSFGLSSVVNVLMFMTCASDEIPDAADAIRGTVAATNEDGESYKLYRERLRGAAEDSVRYGLVKI